MLYLRLQNFKLKVINGCNNGIETFPVGKITKHQVEQKFQCSICCEDFILEENVRNLPCQHRYHEYCLRRWLRSHSTCPNCRRQLSVNENSATVTVTVTNRRSSRVDDGSNQNHTDMTIYRF